MTRVRSTYLLLNLDCDSMWIKTISTSMELLFQGTGNVCGHGHRQEHGLVGFQGQLRGYFR